MKCIEKDPADRYEWEEILNHKIFQSLNQDFEKLSISFIKSINRQHQRAVGLTELITLHDIRLYEFDLRFRTH